MMNVMDLPHTVLNEYETSFLIESDTESFSETTVAEEESEDSEESTACNTASSNSIQKSSPQLHILDKDASIDEDVLPPPLEPIINHVTSKPSVNTSDTDECDFLQRDEEVIGRSIQDEVMISSILRRESSNSPTIRKVSFPKDETELATYREPEKNFPWTITTYLPSDKLLQIYQSSCKRHKTIELDTINKTIMDIQNNTNHSAVLNLSMINVTNEVNETLEDLLKVTNFRSLVLHECKFTAETISEFLNMLEYYESVFEIEILMNFDETAWKCFCNACSNMVVLESLSFRGISINENYMRSLLNAVKHNSRIKILKFDACTLVKLPSFYLVESLMTNSTLCELYLPSTGLYTKEADCLGRFLQRNLFLKILDISNNFIGDRGLEVLAKGLTKQTACGFGLSVLVIFNNQITEKSGPVIGSIISECKNLHTLNIGYNNLTDEVIMNIAPGLEVTTSLEGLGLQSTLLTCKGIEYLTKAIENNTSLQKINLKGNKAIQLAGLERLCQALTSSKIFKIEIDETNRSSHDPQAYVQLVKKLHAICTVNKTFKEASNEEITNISQMVSRKVSLNCEPRYTMPEPTIASIQAESVVSPLPSPGASKSRFQIAKVQDSHLRTTSRFEVTPVISSSEEDLSIQKFANVRSSVSSNDSVDSLQFDTDSD